MSRRAHCRRVHRFHPADDQVTWLSRRRETKPVLKPLMPPEEPYAPSQVAIAIVGAVVLLALGFLYMMGLP